MSRLFRAGRRIVTAVACLALPTMVASTAQARPTGPMLFCEAYPTSPLCEGQSVTCSLCHTSTTPGLVSWNDYGGAVYGALGATEFDAGLAAALTAVETFDVDNDGPTSGEEIVYGSLPGDPYSFEKAPLVPLGDPNPHYGVGGYDYKFALRRIAVAFCGRSPTYAEMQQFEDGGDPSAALHTKLQECLDGPYWRNRMLPRLADLKIRPIDRFDMWWWDYNLFRWALTGDRDARDMLLATYHVASDTDGSMQKVEGVIDVLNEQCVTTEDCVPGMFCVDGPPPDPNRYCSPDYFGQALDPSLRAGLLTTTWFHFYNTMFSALPRQTAAQAYRAYADQDIARQQGIYPTDDDGYAAIDVDGKGILEEECWQCHSTLERLSYPFAKHNGIGGGAAAAYNEDRPTNLGLWDAGDEPVGVIFGTEVSTVREWAEVLAASDEFARMVTKMMWKHAIGIEPESSNAEFNSLWKNMSLFGYNADTLIHAIVDTHSFGAP